MKKKENTLFYLFVVVALGYGTGILLWGTYTILKNICDMAKSCIGIESALLYIAMSIVACVATTCILFHIFIISAVVKHKK